jgi:hypothetical protein
MEQTAERADRLPVAEHRRGEEARPTTAALSAGVSCLAVGGKRPGEFAAAIVAERKSARRRRDRFSDSSPPEAMIGSS